MTKRYTGGVVSSSLPTVNSAGASGVFLLSQQADYQSRNAWPPYKIEESLRFRNSASARLTRTPSVSGNKQIWTVSFWLKTAKSNFDYYCFEASTNSLTDRTVLAFNSGKLQFRHIDGGSAVLEIETTQVFRDPSAWYHIVLAVDTTQATSSNRVKMYLNGSQITAFGTSSYPSQNLNTDWNGATAHAFGASTYPDSYADGYFSEIYNIDGQALTPSAFGATDKDGNWSPIAYTGTYGQNGFYVNFRDNTSATTVGYDYSGNGNNWTLNGFNVSTANTTYDIMIDVPEDQADGTANNRGNYATLNPLNGANNGTLGDGNLSIDSNSGSASAQASAGTMSMKSGKYYFEYTRVQSSNDTRFGIIRDDKFISGSNVGLSASEYGYHVISTGTLSVDGTTTSSWITAFSQGDVGMIAYDADTGKVWFGRNGTWGGSGDPAAGTNPAATVNSFATYGYTAWVRVIGGGSPTIEKGAINFGQRPFAYTVPTGFKSLNTFNLPEPTIKQPNRQFDAVTYTGDGNSTKSITGVNFQPGFAWVKSRSNAQINVLGDVLRGMPNRTLRSDSTDEEQTFGGGNIQSLDSNGITVSYGSVGLNTNESGYTYVAWQWNAGTANTTNTSGSITSQVRANPTAGFSIVTYTGTGGTGTTTVGHGLTVSPSMVMIKRRDVATNWGVYHTGLTSTSYYLFLNSTAGQANYGSTFISPGDSTLTIARDSSILNTNTGTYVAYCFATVAGYSSFGSYTGNGSTDGPFVHTGFRPRYVMLKRTNTTGDWIVYDAARSTYNGITSEIYSNLSNAEDNSNVDLDFVSNGIKFRNSGFGVNGSGDTYIYMAFAEAPFKYARSR